MTALYKPRHLTGELEKIKYYTAIATAMTKTATAFLGAIHPACQLQAQSVDDTA